MQDIGIGLSIGIALKGIGGISVCESFFKKLGIAIKRAGDSA